MPRYFAKNRKKQPDQMDWYDDVYPIDSLRMEVYEAEPAYTGLLDADGNAIYRTIDKIGFL